MTWQRTYDGFESINDLEQDISEALVEVIPPEAGPEWQGKLIVTMQYVKE